MELLLNLFWLTLAVPAVWMWRHESACDQRRRFHRIRLFLLLGCVLMLLFPVVSATDDLHAMRQVMEEAPSKHVVKQAGGDKSFTGLSGPGALPALLLPVPLGPSYEVCGHVRFVSGALPQSARSKDRASRAPPSASPGEGSGFAA
jgi:hypothetical protein